MKSATFTFLLLSLLLLTSCSDETGSPESEIRKYIQAAELAAENRALSDIDALIDDNYIDQKKLDKPRLLNLIRAYFFRHKNIHLITQIESIDIQENNRAFVTLHVAMTASAVNSTSELSTIRARVYHFELQLIKDGQWRVQQAAWKTSSIRNMLIGEKN